MGKEETNTERIILIINQVYLFYPSKGSHVRAEDFTTQKRRRGRGRKDAGATWHQKTDADFIFCHPTASINYNPFTFSSNGLSVILEHIHIKHLSDMISAKNNNPFQPFFFSFLLLYFWLHVAPTPRKSMNGGATVSKWPLTLLWSATDGDEGDGWLTETSWGNVDAVKSE